MRRSGPAGDRHSATRTAACAVPDTLPGADAWMARIGGPLVVVAAFAVLLPVPSGNLRYAVTAGLLAVFTAVAVLKRARPATRALVCLDAAFLIFVSGALTGWPSAVTTVLVCTVPLAALLACNWTYRLRPAAPWLRPGRPTSTAVLLGVAALVVGALAMTVWTAVVRPEPSPYLLRLQELPVWLSVAGIVGFGLVNPIWEEALFRGVILEELTTAWGVRAAVVVQAIIFGAAHWAGFPSGWLGMAMAAAWGLALGVIRVQTGGILASYLVHVGVNATMGTLSVVLLR